MKDISEMTREEFMELPYRESWDKPVLCDSLVILPLDELHDSGYHLMDFVACKNFEPICRVSGCSDVLNIDGIGGYGEDLDIFRRLVQAKRWSIDCLKESGLLRLFSGSNYEIKVGCALSNLEIYGVTLESVDE